MKSNLPLAQLHWNAPDAFLLAACTTLCVAAGVLWLYPPQLRRTPARWRWVLPALRAAALLALVASFLKPSIVRLKTKQEQGNVLVILDASASMSAHDTARTPAQRIALADAIGLLPAGLREDRAAGLDAQMDQLRDLCDQARRARVDVGYARLAGRGVDEAQQRLAGVVARIVSAVESLRRAADSAPPNSPMRAALAALGEVSAPQRIRDAWISEVRMRVDQAADAAGRYQDQLDAELYDQNPQAHFAADQIASMSRIDLAARALAGGGVLKKIGDIAPVTLFAVDRGVRPLSLAAVGGKDPVSARGDASELRQAGEDAMKLLGGQSARAIVMLSDGREIEADGRLNVTARKPLAVPVFAIGAGARTVHDVSFAAATAPSSAFVGETVIVRAQVSSTFSEAAAVLVHLDSDNQHASRTVQLAKDQTGLAEFSVKLGQAGISPLTLRIEPIAGEATTDNNRVTRWIKVLPQRVRVGLIGGWASREFQLTRQALASASWVSLDAQALDPTRGSVAFSPEQIRGLDVLVLDSLPSAAMSQAQWNAVNELVRRRGGSLILAAGPGDLPGGYETNLLATGLMPFPPDFRPAWRIWPGERPAFRFAPAPTAAGLEMLRVDAQAAGIDAAWQSLPGVYRYLPASRLKANATPLLIETESGSPVLTESRLGAGRAFFLGLCETWRWQRPDVRPAPRDLFWLQLVRYAGGAPYAAQADGVAFDIDPVAATPSQAVTLRARLAPAEVGAAAPPTVAVQVMQDGAVIRTIPLAPAPQEAEGCYAATLRGLEAGEYRARLAIDGRSIADLDIPLHVTPNFEAELADVRADEKALRSIADATGGQYLPMDQIRSLPRLIDQSAKDRASYAETRLWDSPLLFAFVVGCLCAEWGLRKKLGLL